jgi:hypothetical protein
MTEPIPPDHTLTALQWLHGPRPVAQPRSLGVRGKRAWDAYYAYLIEVEHQRALVRHVLATLVQWPAETQGMTSLQLRDWLERQMRAAPAESPADPTTPEA